jgi:hypothetical protein
MGWRRFVAALLGVRLDSLRWRGLVRPHFIGGNLVGLNQVGFRSRTPTRVIGLLDT